MAAVAALVVAACSSSSENDDTSAERVGKGDDVAEDEEDADTNAKGDDQDPKQDETEDADEDEDSAPANDDTDPPASPEPVACGEVDCPVPAFGSSCCTRRADVRNMSALEAGKCGIDLSEALGGDPICVELEQPGDLDESCPNLELEGAPPMMGCCSSFGICGALDTFLGLGCTAPPPGVERIPCGD